MLHSIKNLYLRWTRGAGCCDVWGLYHFQAKQIAKQLKEFRRHMPSGYPAMLTSEQWTEYVDEMIWAFEFYSNEDDYNWSDDKIQERATRGTELYGKYFAHLWM